MRNGQKLSNSLLVYSFVMLFILVIIFGIFTVLKLINIASSANLPTAFLDYPLMITVGIISLCFVPYWYKLVKSLKILHIESDSPDSTLLVPYSPLFLSDIPKAEAAFEIKRITSLKQNPYIKKWVTIYIDDREEGRIIRSFIKPTRLSQIHNN